MKKLLSCAFGLILSLTMLLALPAMAYDNTAEEITSVHNMETLEEKDSEKSSDTVTILVVITVFTITSVSTAIFTYRYCRNKAKSCLKDNS